MDPITQQTVIAAAGAGGGDPVYVDDVFSTYLYEGNSGTNPINNGLDLAGEGGLVWCKKRETDGYSYHLYDTERGATKYLSTNSSSDNTTTGTDFSSFNSNGFTLGTPQNIGSGLNATGNDYVSWSFRKAPGFFDVVTYTGNGTAGRTVPHNLGSVPGMIIVKCTTHAENWRVYHKSTGATHGAKLDEHDAFEDELFFWNDTAPTASVFTLGDSGAVNDPGRTYVAYIFADDEPVFGTDEDESIIKCGSFSGNSSRKNIDIGFEPQWVLFKRTGVSSNGSGDWHMFDVMRGMNYEVDVPRLAANTYGTEANAKVGVYESGFVITETSGPFNSSGETYIYMAIRRPHKPPEVGTDVFAVDYGNGSTTIPAFDSGFPVDFAIAKVHSSTDSFDTITRLTAAKALKTDSAAAEVNNGANWVMDSNIGWGTTYNTERISWMFKRAPGFFDVVAYEGSGSAQTVNHNLTVTPELMIIKLRTDVNNWAVYYGDNTHYMRLNNSSSGVDSASWWNDTFPTSTEFTVGTDPEVNKSGYNLLAYLFATLPGISKVGSYTGNGTSQDIDCGFTNGARFVMIKRTSGTGDWYVFDTVRGINVGDEPYVVLNTNAAQVTSSDRIDPHSSGFTVATGFDHFNGTGDTYIFLAIA